ncbi:MAG: hypothetical protein GOMPHAMPRED_001135 [Gomphillus americanus]|uniref:Uncharacterized protein n=1 Tax=Gomphillus americanus TaxID=1940652 RepID=A0A8H3F2I5_9LECA|nr:MAG: hypothetical protein GOMPHAMPRED_001135 [Gomphillus americanus]
MVVHNKPAAVLAITEVCQEDKNELEELSGSEALSSASEEEAAAIAEGKKREEASKKSYVVKYGLRTKTPSTEVGEMLLDIGEDWRKSTKVSNGGANSLRRAGSDQTRGHFFSQIDSRTWKRGIQWWKATF